MLNKHKVRITSSERSYLNSLKQSIRRSIKSIEKTLEPYQQDTYLRRRQQSTFTPIIKKTTVHSFKTREEFLKEVEQLQKTKAELAIYKPRKPKEYDELPKRLQKRHDIESRKVARRRPIKVPRTVRRQEALEKLLRLRFVSKRNALYRDNMIRATIKALPPRLATQIGDGLMKMTEQQFFNFFLTFGPEVISFTYSPEESEHKGNLLLEAINEALQTQ